MNIWCANARIENGKWFSFGPLQNLSGIDINIEDKQSFEIVYLSIFKAIQDLSNLKWIDDLRNKSEQLYQQFI